MPDFVIFLSGPTEASPFTVEEPKRVRLPFGATYPLFAVEGDAIPAESIVRPDMTTFEQDVIALPGSGAVVVNASPA